MMELCVWQLTEKLEKTADEAYFFTSLEPNIKDFRPDLKEKAEANEDLAEMMPRNTLLQALEPNHGI